MSGIKISKEAADRLNEGIRFGNGLEIPFPVLYMRFANGKSELEALAEINPTAYYGGFVADSQPVRDLLDQGNELAAGMVGPVKISRRDGSKYEAFTARRIIIAPIGYRKSWYNEKTSPPQRRSEKSGYFPGSYHHMQVLAYMGTKIDVGYVPWHPVVLTFTGYQVDRATKAFQAWNRHTVQVRNLLSKDAGVQLPVTVFYMAMGTFGPDHIQEMVGQTGAQSPITPVKAFLPENITTAQMEELFVGEKMADEMARLREEAAEWLAGWDKDYNEAAPSGRDEYGGSMAVEEEEDIPF